MDTTSPAPLVNGEILRRYGGRRVRCVIKVTRTEGGGVLVGQTSDNMQISVRQMSPSQRALTDPFVEVIGVADGERSIRAESCTNFGSNFDMSSYDQLCKLVNGEYQDIFV